MNNDQIKKLALENGFKVKQQPNGGEDLNPYVYDFARALLEAANVEEKKTALSNKVLVDLDELEECYRMAVNHIRDNAVDLDEESALLMSICRIKGIIDAYPNA